MYFKNQIITSISEKLAGTYLHVPVVKNPPANARVTGLISGLGRFHRLQGD